MHKYKHQMEVKKRGINKLEGKEKTIAAAFQNSLGENNKFEEFLTRVFKKKIKRVKKKETSGSKGERFDHFDIIPEYICVCVKMYICYFVRMLSVILSGGDVEEEDDSDEDSDEESDRDNDEDYDDSETGPLDDSVCPPGKINPPPHIIARKLSYDTLAPIFKTYNCWFYKKMIYKSKSPSVHIHKDFFVVLNIQY